MPRLRDGPSRLQMPALDRLVEPGQQVLPDLRRGVADRAVAMDDLGAADAVGAPG